MKALSIRQPWAWLIVHGWKDIENRNWPTHLRGPILIHASKGMTEQDYRACCRFLASDSRLAEAYQFLPRMADLERGGIVGRAELTACVRTHPSPWFVGAWGFELAKAQALPFQPCKGALSFFTVNLPEITPNPAQSPPVPATGLDTGGDSTTTATRPAP